LSFEYFPIKPAIFRGFWLHLSVGCSNLLRRSEPLFSLLKGQLKQGYLFERRARCGSLTCAKRGACGEEIYNCLCASAEIM
jgi:hypothetical protein